MLQTLAVAQLGSKNTALTETWIAPPAILHGPKASKTIKKKNVQFRTRLPSHPTPTPTPHILHARGGDMATPHRRPPGCQARKSRTVVKRPTQLCSAALRMSHLTPPLAETVLAQRPVELGLQLVQLRPVVPQPDRQASIVRLCRKSRPIHPSIDRPGKSKRGHAKDKGYHEYSVIENFGRSTKNNSAFSLSFLFAPCLGAQDVVVL